jgi:hypothetical protein
MPARRLAAFLFLAAAACIAHAAEAPVEGAKPRTYALVSAVGDQFQYVRRRPSVGSNLEPFRRFNARVPNGALDSAVLRGLDRTIAANDPASERVFLALNPAEMENVLPADRERIAIGKVVSALEPLKQRAGWDRIFVVTPHYRYGEMQGLGSKLGGIGVFIQPLERGRVGTLDLDTALEGLNDPDTVTPDGQPSRSYTYVAPFFYTKLWVIDPKTLQVIDVEERFDYQKIYDPMWTAVDVAKNFTPEQLAGQVEKFVERASARALREAIGVVTVTDPKAVGEPKAAPPTGPAKP